jgi:uncharacterized damage-inducible protein DinB
MAQYNQWMNRKIYATAGQLPEATLKADKKAFFGSILGTLNHLMVGDIIWLKRFAMHPANHKALETVRSLAQPKSLGQQLYSNYEALKVEREQLDEIIMNWCYELCLEDLHHKLYYKNMKGQPAVKLFGHLVLHLFNHQTHHRGQVTTLLSQEGLDVGVTDLLALIPDES